MDVINQIGATLLAGTIDSALRATVILLAALGVTWLLRRRPAALRHLVLSFAIAGALLTPLMTFVPPSWRPDVVDRALRSVQRANSGAPGTTRAADVATSDALRLESLEAARLRSANAANANAKAGADASPALLTAVATSAKALSQAMSNAAGLIVAAWIAGVIVFSTILLTGLARLRWLAFRARPVSRADADPRGRVQAAMVEEIAAARGVTRPVTLLWNERTWLLVTWGYFRPRVMLPAAAAARWSDERLHIVISHELAHVRRGDWATQLAAEVLRAVFWFNPIVWIACRRLRAESELACDDEVLNGGVEGVDYAGHLLDLARVSNNPRHAWVSAPAMARPSSLEGRISAMLNDGLNRHPVTRAARVVTSSLIIALTFVVAGFAQSTFYSFSGVVVDPMDRTVAGAKLTLTNPSRGATHEIKSDASGRFEFVGLPAGEYGLETTQVGFKPGTQTISIAGNTSNRRIALEVGSLRETISITGSGSGRTATSASRDSYDAAGVVAERQKTLTSCKPDGSNAGGDITPPKKLVHVAPIYPAELSAAGIGGIVTMKALLDTEGDVQEVTVLTSPDPGLAAAAAESVRQWKYTPALLNCTPIDVNIGTTVSFMPKQ